MLLTIGLAVLTVAVIVVVFYLATHHVPAPAQPSAKALSDTLAAAAAESWSALKADLPSIINAELAQAKVDLANAKQYAAELEAKLAAEVAASGARLEAVKAQVGSVIAGIGSLPASAVPVAAVVAAQAEDVAALKAATVALSPAS